PVEQGGVLHGRGVGDERRERVVGADLGDAVDRDEGERLHARTGQATAASVSRASAAATRASVINVSAVTACTPTASISATRDASPASITRVLQNSAYSRATPTHDTSMPSGPIRRSAGPLTGRPAMMGLTPTTRSRRA